MTNRIINDFYPTPDWMTKCLIKHAGIRGSVFEPCAGGYGMIAHHFLNQGVVTNDLHFPNCRFQLDMTLKSSWDAVAMHHRTKWVVTNPPYCVQQLIIQNAFEFAEVGVAMLLRVTADEMVLSDRTRTQWWADHPESLQIKLPRFSFALSSKTGKWTTDSAYCQWVVWRKDNYVYEKPIIRIPHYEIPGFIRKPD